MPSNHPSSVSAGKRKRLHDYRLEDIVHCQNYSSAFINIKITTLKSDNMNKRHTDIVLLDYLSTFASS